MTLLTRKTETSAGKATLLKHLAHRPHNERLHAMVD